MRTTVVMDDIVLRQVKQYARSRSISLSRAMQELVQQGLDPGPPAPTAETGKLAPFRLPKGSPTVTSAWVSGLEDVGTRHPSRRPVGHAG